MTLLGSIDSNHSPLWSLWVLGDHHTAALLEYREEARESGGVFRDDIENIGANLDELMGYPEDMDGLCIWEGHLVTFKSGPPGDEDWDLRYEGVWSQVLPQATLVQYAKQGILRNRLGGLQA
jgi:hypothetical protein